MIYKNDTVSLLPRMVRFLEYQQLSCKQSTLGSYKISLRHFCRFLAKQNKHPKNYLTKLTAANLIDFMVDLNKQDLVPYTKVNYLINLRLYLDWEAEQNNINPDILKVLDRSRLPKVPEYLPKPLSSENDRLLQDRFQKSNSPYALMFLLLRQTGLRISELINLPWDPLVTNNNNESFLKVPLGKMNNERMLPLHAETIELIKKIKDAYPICLNKCNQARLIGLRGSVHSVRSHLNHHFEKFTHAIHDQNKSVTFHRLRHSYATSLLSAGVSIVSIMKLLGHRRIEMSLRYAKVTPQHLRNEYLKAITIIAKQAGIQQPETTISNTQCHPSEIIISLKAYINRTAKIDAVSKKNILRKLTRIKNDFDCFAFAQPFKISLSKNENKKMVRLTG